MSALPTTRATLLPWSLATVLFVVVFSIRERSARWTFFAPSSAGVAGTLAEASVLAAFAGILLWQQLRALYLTPRTELPAFVVTWLLFAFGYPIVGGVLTMTRPDVEFVGWHWTAIDWSLVAACIAAGQYAFVSALALSTVWKTDEPGYGPIRLSREKARMLLGEACIRRRTLTSEEFNQLVLAFEDLTKNASAAAARAHEIRDGLLLQRWAEAAARLGERFQNLAAVALDTTQCENAKAAIAQLAEEEVKKEDMTEEGNSGS